LAPQSLARWGLLEAAEFVTDVMVTLFPLLFLAHASIALSLDGASIHNRSGKKEPSLTCILKTRC
jgi:hypothetical protein